MFSSTPQHATCCLGTTELEPSEVENQAGVLLMGMSRNSPHSPVESSPTLHPDLGVMFAADLVVLGTLTQSMLRLPPPLTVHAGKGSLFAC